MSRPRSTRPGTHSWTPEMAVATKRSRDAGTRRVELAIGGMTCASCATRVERKLNRMDGVTATVNLVTELAEITAAPQVSEADLIRTVETTGYTARRPIVRRSGAGSSDDLPADV